MARAKIISYLNLKGGVGKSTLTALTCSYLHEQGKDVCVIDCDEDQKTMDLWKSEDEEKGKTTYTVLPSLSRDVLELLNEIVDEYEYIFIDFPGNMTQVGVKSIWPYLDVVIVPFYPNMEELDPTLKFHKEFKTFQQVRQKENKQRPSVVKYMYYRTGTTKLGKQAILELEKNGIDEHLLNYSIKHYDTMRNRSSTLNRMQKNAYGYLIDLHCKEVSDLINSTEIKEY